MPRESKSRRLNLPTQVGNVRPQQSPLDRLYKRVCSSALFVLGLIVALYLSNLEGRKIDFAFESSKGREDMAKEWATQINGEFRENTLTQGRGTAAPSAAQQEEDARNRREAYLTATRPSLTEKELDEQEREFGVRHKPPMRYGPSLSGEYKPTEDGTSEDNGGGGQQHQHQPFGEIVRGNQGRRGNGSSTCGKRRSHWFHLGGDSGWRL